MSKVAFVSVALLLAACGTSIEAAPGLENTHWNLVALDGRAAVDGVGVPFLILNSDEKRVTGSGGCNRMTGSYALARTTLTFGPVAATKMACINAGQVEDRFFAALNATRNWRIEGKRLTLLGGSGEKLAELDAAPPRK